MEEKSLSTKKSLIIAGIACSVVIAIFVIIAVNLSKDAYRLIKVNTYNGQVEIKRGDSPIEVREGLKLISEDHVDVFASSNLDMNIDSDKMLRADENTSFDIIAEGDENKGYVYIDLYKGGTLISIDNKLSDESSFEVRTSNGVVGVRGTVFKVTYLEDEDVTVLEVSDGVVHVESKSGLVEDVPAGEMRYIANDDIRENLDKAEASENTNIVENTEEDIEETTEPVEVDPYAGYKKDKKGYYIITDPSEIDSLLIANNTYDRLEYIGKKMIESKCFNENLTIKDLLYDFWWGCPVVEHGKEEFNYGVDYKKSDMQNLFKLFSNDKITSKSFTYYGEIKGKWIHYNYCDVAGNAPTYIKNVKIKYKPDKEIVITEDFMFPLGSAEWEEGCAGKAQITLTPNSKGKFKIKNVKLLKNTGLISGPEWEEDIYYKW